MANDVFNRGLYTVAKYDISALSLRAMLVSTSFVFDDALNTVDDGSTSDPASYEISVSGYSRQSLANVSLTEDDTNDFAYLDADNVTFSALAAGQTVGGCILYRYSSSGGTTSDTGQDLIAFYDVTDTPTNGGDISIVWASSSQGGVLKIST